MVYNTQLIHSLTAEWKLTVTLIILERGEFVLLRESRRRPLVLGQQLDPRQWIPSHSRIEGYTFDNERIHCSSPSNAIADPN